MRRKKDKETPFAVSKDDRLFVRLSAITTWLVALVDGLTLTYFGKDRTTPYLEIDTAIEWCKKESQFHNPAEYGVMVDVLERAKRELAEGTAIIRD